MVSINTDRGTFTNEGEMNNRGIQVLAHELKHCFQFCNGESYAVQTGEGFQLFNSEALESAAFRRSAALGSNDIYDPNNYRNFQNSESNFTTSRPGCCIIRHD